MTDHDDTAPPEAATLMIDDDDDGRTETERVSEALMFGAAFAADLSTLKELAHSIGNMSGYPTEHAEKGQVTVFANLAAIRSEAEYAAARILRPREPQRNEPDGSPDWSERLLDQVAELAEITDGLQFQMNRLTEFAHVIRNSRVTERQQPQEPAAGDGYAPQSF